MSRVKGVLRAAGAVLMVAGATLALHSGFLVVKAHVARRLIGQAYRLTVQQGGPQRPWSWADTHPVARLRIPALDYDEVVLEGASLRAMAFGPVHMEQTAAPGERGNVVLAGHRNNWFLPLRDIAVGHRLELEWPGAAAGTVARAAYTVVQVEVIEPKDTRFVQPLDGNVLTLITCYPFTAAPTSPYRLAVRAVRVDALTAR